MHLLKKSAVVSGFGSLSLWNIDLKTDVLESVFRASSNFYFFSINGSKLSTLSSLPGGSSYLNTSNNHNDLFYMAGTGLDRGGSALSALPEYGSSAYGPQRNSPNPYMSQWQGSSQHRSSTKTIGSRFSSLLQSSTFEEASMNFKGKSCWWNKNNNKRFKKTKKLPNTSSREFEKSMRDRYGHVKV